MSARILTACAAVLLLSVSTPAQPDRPGPKPQIAQLLDKQIQLTPKDLEDAAIFELLPKVSKRHDITFIVMDEQFKSKGIFAIRERKSPLKKFDPSGLTVRQFLIAWLGSIDATYRANADYVEIVPIAAVNEIGTRRAPFPADSLEALLAKLHRDEMVPLGGRINEMPLGEIVRRLAENHDIPFVINDETFRAVGVADVRARTANLFAIQLREHTLHQFLTTFLRNLGATYLIKGKTIEIVSPEYAIRATKAAAHDDENGRKVLRHPLVSAVIKEKPLAEAVAIVAERYDLSVVVSPQAGDGRAALVTARLLNVPADRALELLALQADLRVVRKGAAFLVTSREHADELFAEELKKARAKREAETAPAPKSGPAQPPK